MNDQKVFEAQMKLFEAQNDRLTRLLSDQDKMQASYLSNIDEHTQEGLNRLKSYLEDSVNEKIAERFKEHISSTCNKHDLSIEELKNNQKIVFSRLDKIEKNFNFRDRVSIFVTTYGLAILAALGGIAVTLIIIFFKS